MMKKAGKIIISVIIVVCALFNTFCASAATVEYKLDQSSAPEINADAAILVNVNTDEILYEKNSAVPVYPASSVKIMTAILALEHISDLDNTVITASSEAVRSTLGNNIAIKEGEEFTARQLLYALLVGTANDAANVLAMHIGGSISGFVDMMNSKAIELGAENTTYTNPTGMHDQQMKTTAYDTSLIARYACCNSTLVEIASTQSYVLEKTNKSAQRTLYNKNLFISPTSNYYYKDAKGLNSGNTEQAGYNLITMATEKGIPLLCVVLSCDKDSDGTIHSYIDSKNLYTWAFGSYNYVTVLRARQVSYEMPVKLSAQKDYVLICPSTDIELLLPVNIDVNTDIKKVFSIEKDHLEAPIAMNTVVGEVVLLYNDEIIATAELITAEDISRSDILYYIQVVENATSTTWFKVSAISFSILFAIYLVVSVVRKKKRENDNYIRRRR